MPYNNTKVPLTLKVDIKRKILFDSTKSIHGKFYSDILEPALDEFLMKYVPEEILEIKIQETEQRLADLRQTLAEAKFVSEMRKSQKKEAPASNEPEQELAQFRKEKLDRYKEELTWQKSTNQLDWSKISDMFRFSTKNEARDWLLSQLQVEA